MTTIIVGYSATFDGAGFYEQTIDGMYVEPDAITLVTINHIAGTDTNDISEDGDDAVTFELPIGATASQLSALRAKRKASGSLVYHAGTITAYLKDIINQRSVDGADAYKATLRFIV